MTHNPHGSIKEEGLNDECERCAEHAEHPFSSLDDSNIIFLTERVTGGFNARTINEGKAMSQIYEVINHYNRLKKLIPNL